MNLLETKLRKTPIRIGSLCLVILISQVAIVNAWASMPEIQNPLELTEEMQAWIDDRVFYGHSESVRARNLMAALNSLELVYRPGQTGTAADVFETRRFNCVSFSFLFVGLSRHVGLKTHFLRTVDDPGYTNAGELVVVSEHMTAGVRDGVQSRVLEFRFLPDPATQRFQRLTDEQATALYFSNLGAERLLEHDPITATQYFEIATEHNPDLPELWVNLGVAKRRAGNHEGAEAAYLKALEVDPVDSRAYLNLASLMWRRGEVDASGRLLDLLEKGNPRDPHAYLVLGDHAMRGQRWKDAERFYRRAIRKDRSSGHARASLGLLLLRQGEAEKAIKQLRRAQKRDPHHAKTLDLARVLASHSLDGELPPQNGE